MAAQTSASSSRASAKRAQRRAKRSESLSGSMRQFLTPGVWKQVKQAASQHGCRNGVRWTLQPLIMIAAIMTWCAGETDADRFVLSRSFYVQLHCPKRQRPGKAFSGFCKALLGLPMPVWWAFCDAVRSRVFHLLADRMTMGGCPGRHCRTGRNASRSRSSARRLQQYRGFSPRNPRPFKGSGATPQAGFPPPEFELQPVLPHVDK